MIKQDHIELSKMILEWFSKLYKNTQLSNKSFDTHDNNLTNI